MYLEMNVILMNDTNNTESFKRKMTRYIKVFVKTYKDNTANILQKGSFR